MAALLSPRQPTLNTSGRRGPAIACESRSPSSTARAPWCSRPVESRQTIDWSPSLPWCSPPGPAPHRRSSRLAFDAHNALIMIVAQPLRNGTYTSGRPSHNARPGEHRRCHLPPALRRSVSMPGTRSVGRPVPEISSVRVLAHWQLMLGMARHLESSRRRRRHRRRSRHHWSDRRNRPKRTADRSAVRRSRDPVPRPGRQPRLVGLSPVRGPGDCFGFFLGTVALFDRGARFIAFGRRRSLRSLRRVHRKLPPRVRTAAAFDELITAI
jgi:hypothetical protein